MEHWPKFFCYNSLENWNLCCLSGVTRLVGAYEQGKLKMKMKRMLAVLGAMMSGTTMNVFGYIYTGQSTGTTGEISWGTEPFTGDFEVRYDNGVDELTFPNRINFNGNNVEFKIPAGKTLYLAEGVTNNVAYTKTSEDQANGAIIRSNSSEYTGTLVVSKGCLDTRLRMSAGRTVIENVDQTTRLYYYYMNRNPTFVINGGTVRSYGEIANDGGKFQINDVTLFYKEGNSTYNGSWNCSHGTMEFNRTTIDAGGSALLKVGGVYSSGVTHDGRFIYNGHVENSMRLQAGFYIGNYGRGTFDLNGGKFFVAAADGKPQVVGNGESSEGVFNVAGGEWQIEGYPWSAQDAYVNVYIGKSGKGTLNVSTGGIVTLMKPADSENNRSRIHFGYNVGSEGVLNLLEGGTFAIRNYGPIGGAGTSRFHLNGGRFVMMNVDSSSTRNVLTNFTECSVGPKGGEFCIDYSRNKGRIPQPLTAYLPDEPITGELKKTGRYELTLTGANTYRVPTHVVGGTLQFAQNATIPYSTVSVDSGATLDLVNSGMKLGGVGVIAGTLSNAGALEFGGETQPGGVHAVGTTQITCSSLLFATGSKYVVDIDKDGNCDKLVVNASTPIDLSKLVVNISLIDGQKPANVNGTILECSAGFTGEVPRLPGWVCTVDTTGKKLSVCRMGIIVIVR